MRAKEKKYRKRSKNSTIKPLPKGGGEQWKIRPKMTKKDRK